MTRRDDSLQLVSRANPPADVMDQFGQRNPQFPFDNGRFVDVSADAVKLRPGVLLVRPDALVPVHTARENVRQVGQRLHVVDDCRATVQTVHCRKRWLLARMAPFSFKRLQQSGFLPTDVRPCSGMEDDVQVEVRSQDSRTKNPLCAGFFEGPFQHPVAQSEFTPDVDECQMTLDCIRRNNHAFNQLMRDHAP